MTSELNAMTVGNKTGIGEGGGKKAKKNSNPHNQASHVVIGFEYFSVCFSLDD